ncbi:MAG: helix-turn-helix domain-containing protein [Caenispirillum sp.]|nr:helix-turn-helix domain-containing protein [Caenispirillum sp.]
MTDRITIPRATSDAMRERLEDLEDIVAARAAEHDECLPHDFVARLLSGEESPLRLWRRHRGLTQQALSEASGVGQDAIAEMESGRKTGTVEAYRALAAALDVSVDELLPPAD